MLVESTKATWLVGTAYEHNTLYQYNLNNAQNVYIGMQQSETPYWQGSGSASLAPAPWTAAGSDPTFSNCGSSDGQVSSSLFPPILRVYLTDAVTVSHGMVSNHNRLLEPRHLRIRLLDILQRRQQLLRLSLSDECC